jgi:hypothetical protein
VSEVLHGAKPVQFVSAAEKGELYSVLEIRTVKGASDSKAGFARFEQALNSARRSTAEYKPSPSTWSKEFKGAVKAKGGKPAELKTFKNADLMYRWPELPQVLFIHFSFAHGDAGNIGQKLRGVLDVPTVLQLDPLLQLPGKSPQDAFCAEAGGDFVYDLTGVVHHIGEEIQHGHYIADCKNPRCAETMLHSDPCCSDGSWYRCDDDSIEPVAKADVLKTAAGRADPDTCASELSVDEPPESSAGLLRYELRSAASAAANVNDDQAG